MQSKFHLRRRVGRGFLVARFTVEVLDLSRNIHKLFHQIPQPQHIPQHLIADVPSLWPTQPAIPPPPKPSSRKSFDFFSSTSHPWPLPLVVAIPGKIMKNKQSNSLVTSESSDICWDGLALQQNVSSKCFQPELRDHPAVLSGCSGCEVQGISLGVVSTTSQVITKVKGQRSAATRALTSLKCHWQTIPPENPWGQANANAKISCMYGRGFQ